MNELRPYGRELLESARREHTPGADARTRVHEALFTGRGPAPGSAGTGLSVPPLRGITAVLTLLALLFGIACALYLAGHRR